MIDIEIVRSNKGAVTDMLTRRGMDDRIPVLETILKNDAAARELEEEISEQRRERNVSAKQKPSAEEMKEMAQLRARIQEREKLWRRAKDERDALLLTLPNFLHDSVPDGAEEKQNVILEKIGKLPKFSFTPRAHEHVAAVASDIDSVRGAKVSGTRFYYLKNNAAILERALMQYAIDFMLARNFLLVLPPLLVGEGALIGTGYFPNGRNEVYAVNPNEDDLFLIGTSEQPIMAMHCNEVIDARALPLRYVGYSSCFRREAGSYGKDTSGILRVHQFNKVEMLIIARSDDSWKYHEEMIEISKTFYETLGIPFQLSLHCAGDTGAQSARTVDIEGWFPSQNKYRELGSASNTTDYQTRRLHIRTKEGSGKPYLLHALNNTVVADRALLCIIENYQQKDGSVVIPDVLRPYAHMDVLLAP